MAQSTVGRGAATGGAVSQRGLHGCIEPADGGAAPRRVAERGAPLRGAAFLSLDWLFARPCPLCRRLPPAGTSCGAFCSACAADLALPSQALSGRAPLHWWSSASYAGAVRGAVLRQKSRPDPALLVALVEPLSAALAALELPRTTLLVPIPSWKRQVNRLPGRMADALARRLRLQRQDLLARSRVVLSQHHLGQRLRQANQAGSFTVCRRGGRRPEAPVLLIDDVLTTGSTLRHAALCLEEAGWRVLGAACLARTPDRRDWLRTP